VSDSVARLKEIVARLRAPDGCPWDREQNHESLRASLLEECHEAIDAINRADDKNLCEELGDLLLLVVMHAQMGAERGAFHFEEVAASVCEKMIRRHPHVFGESSAADSGEVLRQWEQIKREEKGGGESASVLSGLARSLPALLRAQNVQKKAARVGFDWPDAAGPLQKIEEEARELEEAVALGDPGRIEEELGDFLFSAVNLSRKLGLDAETVLCAATEKFIRRFQRMEEAAALQGRRIEDLGFEEQDALWEMKKADEK
jgi:MazG family protein